MVQIKKYSTRNAARTIAANRYHTFETRLYDQFQNIYKLKSIIMTTLFIKLRKELKLNLKLIGVLCLSILFSLSSCVDSRTPEQLTDALFEAISKSDCEEVKVLLAKGADPNGKDHPSKMLPLRNAAVKGQIDCVKYLLEAGADPTTEVHINSGGTEMIMRTVISVKAVRQLLKNAMSNPYGIDPRTQELIDSGVTIETFEEIIQMLEEAEKNFEMTN